ncbi:hypothetical protein KAT92_00885, partial [Candidatus Babeliales bacterium]|nr:hypothetical protein [Candidatus Babeliales bacterium]
EEGKSGLEELRKRFVELGETGDPKYESLKLITSALKRRKKNLQVSRDVFLKSEIVKKFKEEVALALPEIGDEKRPSEQTGKAIEAFRRRQIDSGKLPEDVETIYVALKQTKRYFTTFLLGATIEEESHRKNFEITKSACPIPFQENNTAFILLSYLWKKVVSKKDFTNYFNEIKSGLGLKLFRESSCFEVLEKQEFSKQDYEDIENAQKDLLGGDIEKLAFYYWGYDLYINPLPPLVPMESDVEFKGTGGKTYTFPDCGETSLRNFLNALLYNPETTEFDIVKLKKLTKNKTLIEYYEKRYRTAKNIIDMQAHHDWAQVVSNIKGGIYKSNGVGCKYEITAGIPGMLSILRVLLDQISFENFDELAESLSKKLEIYIDIEESPGSEKRFGDIRFNFDEAEITWRFEADHFEMKYPEAEKTTFFSSHAKLLQEKMAKYRELIPFFVLYFSNLKQILAEDILGGSLSIVKSAILLRRPVDWIEHLIDGRFPISANKKTFGLINGVFDGFVVLAKGYLSSRDHDLIHRGKVVLGFLLERDRGIEVAIEAAKRLFYDNSHTVLNVAKYLFNKLIEKGHGTTEALQVAKDRAADKNEGVRRKALELFKRLVKKDVGLTDALQVAKDRVADWDSDVQRIALQLLGTLLEKNVIDSKTLQAMPTMITNLLGIKYRDDIVEESFRLFENLVARDIGLNEAIDLATDGVDDSQTSEQVVMNSLGLLEALVSKGKVIDLAISAAEKNVNHLHSDRQGGALDLLIKLVKNGYAFKQARVAIDKTINSYCESVKKTAQELKKQLAIQTSKD